MSTLSPQQKREILETGNGKLPNLELAPNPLLLLEEYLLSTLGTTLVSTSILKMPSLSSMNNVSWEMVLGLDLSKELPGRTVGFSLVRLREILGLIMSQYSLRMGSIRILHSSSENMSSTPLTLAIQGSYDISM